MKYRKILHQRKTVECKSGSGENELTGNIISNNSISDMKNSKILHLIKTVESERGIRDNLLEVRDDLSNFSLFISINSRRQNFTKIGAKC